MNNGKAKRLALQIACQLPSDPLEARLVYWQLGHLLDEWLFAKTEEEPAKSGGESQKQVVVAFDRGPRGPG